MGKPPRINAAKIDPDVQAGACMVYMCMQMSLLVRAGMCVHRIFVAQSTNCLVD